MKIIDNIDVGEEISVLRELNHANIVRLITTDTSLTHAFLGMELCNFSLSDQLEDHRYGMEEWRVFKLMVDFLSGFKHMREHGIVHLDIKPANILMGYDDKYKICDFGFAQKKGDDDVTDVAGTFAYCHPSIFALLFSRHLPNIQIQRRAVKPTVDIWSFFATVFEASTGNVPFDAESCIDMYQLMIRKSDDDICGRIFNGDFHYSVDFPNRKTPFFMELATEMQKFMQVICPLYPFPLRNPTNICTNIIYFSTERRKRIAAVQHVLRSNGRVFEVLAGSSRIKTDRNRTKSTLFHFDTANN